MHPILFHIAGIPAPAYGILNLVAFAAGITAMAWLASKDGIPFRRAADLAILTTVVGEAGARLTFVLVEFNRIASGEVPLRQMLFGGRVVLGGVVAGFACAIWLSHRNRFRVVSFTDAGVTGTALGMGIGRIGCVMAGCCYGKPTGLPWGITFTDPIAHRINGTPLGIALHPTQILQSLDGLFIFAFLVWLHGRRRFVGEVSAAFLILTGAARFLVEFLRDDPRGAAYGLATSQWIGLATLVAGTVWWILGRSRARPR